MDTIVTQQIYTPGHEDTAREAAQLLRSLEQQLSVHLVDSEADRINQNAGNPPIQVDSNVFSLLVRAKELSKQTGGLFDVTIGPLSVLWGITSNSPRVPAPEEIGASRALVDWKKLLLDHENLSVTLAETGMRIDLGGIAKGYASDKVTELYRAAGVASALASIGGNVVVVGARPDGNPFSVGIRDPLGGPNDAVATLSVTDTTLSTTGAYERYFEIDGTRYHHVLDPRTGYPADTDLMSVTIVSQDGVLADAMSTAIFIGGRQMAETYLHETDFSVIAIDKNKNILISDSLRPDFSLTQAAQDAGYHILQD